MHFLEALLREPVVERFVGAQKNATGAYVAPRELVALERRLHVRVARIGEKFRSVPLRRAIGPAKIYFFARAAVAGDLAVGAEIKDLENFAIHSPPKIRPAGSYVNVKIGLACPVRRRYRRDGYLRF